MGLDMYAYAANKDAMENPGALTDLQPIDHNEGVVMLMEWRKHPNLHGWMKRLYLEKGGVNPEFNMNTVRLDAADLDALEAVVLVNNLPNTRGFFFGTSRPDDKEDDIAFIAAAREALSEGKIVFYDSWW
jgi:hypothetical protein